MRLLTPIRLGSAEAPNRILFGPHATNLGYDRSLSDRHVAYYHRRAAGGCGTIVVEEASVHDSDWPYERAPLARECEAGWRAVADACRVNGSLVLAGLGHSGGQGTSHWSQRELWAPSDEPEVNTREVPKVMEAADIAEVVAGFGAAAASAVAAGLDGVEINAGQQSLVRQFCSGLTNRRGDAYGDDKLRFAREVIQAVRAGVGSAVVGLRLSCDELAPWAGITPESAVDVARHLVEQVDYLVVVRGSIFTVPMTRPDTHAPIGFNLDLVRDIRAGIEGMVPVVAQGSIVDIGQAEGALDEDRCDLVEMTRAQIAEPDLGVHAADEPGRIRPCVRCNQLCNVRDNRNPIVSCIGQPSSGHEVDEPHVAGRSEHQQHVLVVGGGPGGLEAAVVAAERGHRVTLVERSGRLGGMVNVAAAGAGRASLMELTDWLAREVERLGVMVELGREIGPSDLAGHDGPVIIATGSVPGRPTMTVDPDAVVSMTAADLLVATEAGRLDDLVPSGPVAVIDPIGGPIGVSVAELLAPDRPVHLVTQDHFAGQMLGLTGDLAPANVRLAQAGVTIEARSVARRLTAAGVEIEHRFTGETSVIAVALVVDAGHRLADEELWAASGRKHVRIGDAVAPRTIHEAILEARRAILDLDI